MIDLKDQIEVKDASETVNGWRRNIFFTWHPEDEDVAYPCKIVLYWSEFDGYEVFWRDSDVPPQLKDLPIFTGSRHDLGEFLDEISYKKVK